MTGPQWNMNVDTHISAVRLPKSQQRASTSDITSNTQYHQRRVALNYSVTTTTFVGYGAMAALANVVARRVMKLHAVTALDPLCILNGTKTKHWHSSANR